MAAAVVPSRARAQARPPPGPDPLTYIRVTVQIDTLQGPTLSTSPVRYYFQWMRAGTAAKVSAAKSIQSSGAFSEKMALYARVRKHATTFVSEDPAEPLLTQLVLVQVTSHQEQTLIASTDFDIAKYLASIVAAKTKTVKDTLQLSNIATASVSITIKAIGENHLFTTSQSPTPNSLPTPEPITTDSTEMDEATAAMELEKLRQEIHEKGKRISSLEQSANTMDTTMQQQSRHFDIRSNSSHSTDVNETIRSLEEKLSVAEHDRTVAEGKVQAHVAHAAKIKETYNQLAAWYNNLRQEHAALQEKQVKTEKARQTDDSSGNSKDSDEAYKNLEKERDELRQQLDREIVEKKNDHSRNSQLLETKARTLAELRDQWEATQTEMQHAQQQAENSTKQVKEMESSIEELKKQLAERENALEENKRALTDAQNTMQDVEARHLQALSAAKTNMQAAEDETKENIRKEMEQLKLKHEEELKKVVEERQQLEEELLKAERQKAQEEQDKAVEACKSDLMASFDGEKQNELDVLRKEYEEKLETEKNNATSRIRELEENASKLHTEKEILEQEKMELDLKMKDISDDHEGRIEEISDTIQSIRHEHIQKMEQLTTARDNALEELDKLKESYAKELDEANNKCKSLNEQISSLTQQCEMVQSDLDAAHKDNEQMRSSPRHINGTGESESEMEQIGAKLNNEISELKILLKSETDKRNETANLLARADKEHDELREMVSRLRSERDQALTESQNAKEQLPNPEIKHASVQRNATGPTEAQEIHRLSEERDETIHELFKVRKALNREIKRLKKENAQLSEDSSNVNHSDRSAPQSSENSDVVQVKAERDQAMSEARTLKESLVAQEANVLQKEEKIIELQETLSDANQELSTLKEEMTTINAKLSAAEEEMRTYEEVLQRLREEHSTEAQRLQGKLSTSEAKIQEHESIISKLTTDAENANRSVTDIVQMQERAENDRDAALSKVTALSAELESLKASHTAISSSTNSAEIMLKDAQQELVEKKSEVEVLKLQLSSTQQASDKKLAEMSTEFSVFKEQQLSQVSKLKEAASSQKKQLEEEKTLRSTFENEKLELENEIRVVNDKHSLLERELLSVKERDTELERQLSDGQSATANLDEKYQALVEKEQRQNDNIISLQSKQEEDAKSLQTLNDKLTSLQSSSDAMVSELAEVQGKLKASETVKAELVRDLEAANDEKKVLVEKLVSAKAEVDQWKKQLDDTIGKLEETTKNHSDVSKADSTAMEALKGLNENLKLQCSSLEDKISSVEYDLKKSKESNSVLTVRLTTLEKQIGELEASRTKEQKTIASISGKLENMSIERQQLEEEYRKLDEDYNELEQSRATSEAEANSALEEKSQLEKQSHQLERNVVVLQKRLSQMREDTEKSLAEMRSESDRDTRTANEVRRDLRGARETIRSLQAEIENLTEANKKLEEERDSAKDSDGPDEEVLSNLINTRLELAYAQEETIRLKNKLKKVMQKGPGSASFER